MRRLITSFPDGKRLIVLAQIDLYCHGEKYGNQVYVLPKHLDVKVARLRAAAACGLQP